MGEFNSEQIERIVVRGTNWVGDAVMTVPALRQLRNLFPKAHITLATRSWAEGLFADADFFDDLQVHEGSGLRSVVQQVRQWRKRNFDLAVIFPNSLETALVASLARVPLRIGYAKDGRQALLTHPLALPEWRNSKHEVFYYLKIVAELEWLTKGEQTFLDTQPDSSLEVSGARKSAARAFLRAHGVDIAGSHQRLVALCPGSINSRAKRWPTERYAALADRLIDELGARVLLIGSAAEAEVSLEVSRQMRNEPVMLTGQTNLAELVAVLSLVDLLVTNDTGPAHIASALGRPTLVIFGPTNPLTTRPFSPYGEIVREPPDCAPCMLRDCPIDHRCMTAITPDAVLERARVLLSNRLSHQPFVTSQQTPLSEAINKLKVAGQL
ncbi:MAG TPA: lipopolysaccharide heptosyltransferase II [Pyrinomonadaceae bacterium]|jgi:heptosyltransferase-2|nr:lipopolysaccharide heptosyltransferase II [Pyrinomonadaceae bacterium]